MKIGTILRICGQLYCVTGRNVFGLCVVQLNNVEVSNHECAKEELKSKSNESGQVEQMQSPIEDVAIFSEGQD